MIVTRDGKVVIEVSRFLRRKQVKALEKSGEDQKIGEEVQRKATNLRETGKIEDTEMREEDLDQGHDHDLVAVIGTVIVSAVTSTQATTPNTTDTETSIETDHLHSTEKEDEINTTTPIYYININHCIQRQKQQEHRQI